MDVHQPGSIVRIRMKNFVTYSSAEFKCGPNLNMIIGPNGTGKSSLVCAICLGLGWSASFLGRAKDVGEYVKHGSKQAEIEIELKAGVHHRRNPVVRRVIKREGNKTSWSINGSSASHKDVRKLAHQFNIQVDNLCQFLPQDRVVEFAALTPVQLLEQTQKAVGTEQMVKWHNSLTELSKERKDLVAKKNTAAEKLHGLQKVQNRQKADVDRMQERVQLQRRLDALEQLRPTVIGQQYVREYRELRAKKIEVAELVQRLKAESQPHLDEVESKKGYQRQIKAVLDHHKKMLESARRKADRTAKEGDHLKGRIGDCDNQISSKRKAKIERKKAIASIQAKIAALEEKLKSPPPEFSEQELNEKRRALSSQGRENADQLLEIGARTRVDVEKMQASASQKIRLLGELKGLSTMSGRQMHKLKNRSMDTFRAWQWIEEHRDRFQSDVFAPPIVSCSVKRPEYADAIETAMQQNDFLAITVTNQQDFKLLSNQLYSQMGLQDITLRTSSRPLGDMQRPVGDTALKQEFGFDGWLIDGLEGPEPVLAMLCGSARLHSCAFTLRTLSEDRLRQLQNSNIQQWCTKDEMCSIVRRKEYGPAAVSTTVRRLGTARFWTDQGVDPGRQAELEAELTEAEESFEQLKKTVQEAQAVMKEKKAHAEGLKEEIVRSQSCCGRTNSTSAP
jgi:chromosome segregation ATPase